MTELTHFGILGMKWGVRKDDKSGRTSSKKGFWERVNDRFETAEKNNEKWYVDNQDKKQYEYMAKKAAKIEEKLKKDSVWFRGMKERSLADYKAEMRLTPEQRYKIYKMKAETTAAMSVMMLPSISPGPIVVGVTIPTGVLKLKYNMYKEELDKIRGNRK